MVGFILVGVALVALAVLMFIAYRHPGPDQAKPGSQGESR